jgi:hypothetical protein
MASTPRIPTLTITFPSGSTFRNKHEPPCSSRNKCVLCTRS